MKFVVVVGFGIEARRPRKPLGSALQQLGDRHCSTRSILLCILGGGEAAA
jgi:hypothetical protein